MIVVDIGIFRDQNSRIGGFDKVPYLINVNHPIMNQFYKRFKERNKIPVAYPPSDKQRAEFENWIIDLIKEGKIKVEGISAEFCSCLQKRST